MDQGKEHGQATRQACTTEEENCEEQTSPKDTAREVLDYAET